MRSIATFLFICAASINAHAVNKCTDKSGKVTYQAAACDGGSTSNQIQVTPDPKMSPGSWEFSQQKDPMTGNKTCFATSPVTLTNWQGRGSKFAHVVIQLAATIDSQSLTVRSFNGSEGLFHNNISGLGIRVDQQDFVPLTRKIGSHGLGFTGSDEGKVLGQLVQGKEVRLRLRFWPWDKIEDTSAITLNGFRQASVAMNRCAGQP